MANIMKMTKNGKKVSIKPKIARIIKSVSPSKAVTPAPAKAENVDQPQVAATISTEPASPKQVKAVFSSLAKC